MTNLVKCFRTVIFAFVLVMGVAGFNSNAFAAENVVGVVNFQVLMNQHPDMASAQQTLKAETEQAKKDFDENIKNMKTDEEKQAYYNQLQQRLINKRDELFGGIEEKVIAAIKEVADAKGITVVVDKSVAIYGGLDITTDVGKKLTDKK